MHRNVKGSKRNNEACEPFWELVEPLFASDDVEEGTLMNFPCMRSGGEFFAMPHHESGDAVLKMHKDRVAELIAAGVGEPFGPGKKAFKEWVLVSADHQDQWLDLLAEAKAFVNPAATG